LGNSNVPELDPFKPIIYMSLPSPVQISIITAVFNNAKSFQRMILSLIPQLSNQVEFIVVDGGSTDGTIEIIKKYEKHMNYWISEPDSGIYQAWNKGIRHSTGNYVCFIGSDDRLEPDYISVYLDELEINKTCNLLYSRIRVEGAIPYERGSQYDEKNLSSSMSIPHVGALHSRNIFRIYGLFSEAYQIAGDYELLLRARKYLRVHFIDRVLLNMGANGVSHRNVLQVIAETRMAKIKYQTKPMLFIYAESLVSYAAYFTKKLINVRPYDVIS